MANLEDFDLDKLSPEDLRAILDADPRVIKVKRQVAEQAVEYWKGIVPPNVLTGRYRDSIHVEQDGNKITVVASDQKAHWIEYGAEHTPEYAPRQKTDDHFRSLDVTIEL